MLNRSVDSVWNEQSFRQFLHALDHIHSRPSREASSNTTGQLYILKEREDLKMIKMYSIYICGIRNVPHSIAKAIDKYFTALLGTISPSHIKNSNDLSEKNK